MNQHCGIKSAFLHAGLIICLLLMLPACTSNETPVLKSTAKEVFKDTAVTRLAEAAARGDRETIRDLVRQGVDVNTRGSPDFSVLEWAFFNKSIEGMLALLEAGADPGLADSKGYTVMHMAAGIEDPELLQALLDAGVSPDLRNSKGQTPIFEAIWHDREPQFRSLIAAGADVNAQELSVNSIAGPNGGRPLHQAAMFNDGKRILALLEAGADPQAVNGFGSTFQYYLNRLNESIATTEFIESKRKIEKWLVEHGVALERDRTSTADKTDTETRSP